MKGIKRYYRKAISKMLTHNNSERLIVRGKACTVFLTFSSETKTLNKVTRTVKLKCNF